MKQEKNLNASQGKWVYYSFEKNAIVQVADPQNSLDWDIAFFAYYAKLNGGASGKGQAGVAKLKTRIFLRLLLLCLTNTSRMLKEQCPMVAILT